MAKRNQPSNSKAESNSRMLKLLQLLTLLLKIIGGFPYSAVEEGKGSLKGRTEGTTNPILGPYKMNPLVSVWSVMMVALTVGGVVLLYLETPDSSVLFGASKLLGLLHILTMKVEVATAFLIVLMLVCFSPRLVRLMNLLQHVCGDVICPWKPHKDVTFMMLFSVVIISKCCSSVAMFLAYSYMRETIEINPYLTVMTCMWMGCKTTARNVVVILLYLMGHILASLYPSCSLPFSTTEKKETTKLCGHLEHENRKDNKRDVSCVTEENKNGTDKLGGGRDEKWKAGAEEEARALCEKLFRLNECQQALNDYFSWPVTVLAIHATFIVSEMVFFLSIGRSIIPYMNIVCWSNVLDSLAHLGFIFFSPGDILDQVM